jgi:hypothetical protein
MSALEEFAENYASQVDELGEFPAKHIINSLTIIARENQDQETSGVIANLIKQKLAQVNSSPRHILAIFYLPHSIFPIHSRARVARFLCAPCTAGCAQL